MLKQDAQGHWLVVAGAGVQWRANQLWFEDDMLKMCRDEYNVRNNQTKVKRELTGEAQTLIYFSPALKTTRDTHYTEKVDNGI